MSVPKKFLHQSLIEDFYRPHKDGKSRLHELWQCELEDNKQWLRKTNPTYSDIKDLTYYRVAIALGLDCSEPELMVRYYIRIGKLKGLKIPHVANFMIQVDIDRAFQDDIDMVKEIYIITKECIKIKKRIPIMRLAQKYNVDKNIIRKFTKKVKDKKV